MTLRVRARHVRGEVNEIRATAKKQIQWGEICEEGGTWGFAAHSAKKGEKFALIISCALIELNKTASLASAEAGQFLFVAKTKEPKQLETSGNEDTLNREHVGIIYDTPESSDKKIFAVWGLQ